MWNTQMLTVSSCHDVRIDQSEVFFCWCLFFVHRWKSFGLLRCPQPTEPEPPGPDLDSAANQPCWTRTRRRGLKPCPITWEDQWTRCTLRSCWAACVPEPERLKTTVFKDWSLKTVVVFLSWTEPSEQETTMNLKWHKRKKNLTKKLYIYNNLSCF